jgi:hypothetical protein
MRSPLAVLLALLLVPSAAGARETPRSGGSRPAHLAREAPAREEPLPAEGALDLPRPELGGVRLSGSFVGSVSYNSRLQLVPEFAGSAPVTSEARSVDARFDQFTLGAFKSFAPWLSAGASIEVERHGHRHSHGLDPDFGCPGDAPCVEQFGAEPPETELSLHRFALTAIAPVGNGLALSFGRFDVPFGQERHDAALNLTATTSELQRFGRPQSMTGLQAAYAVGPWLDLAAWVVNRWDNETTEDAPEDNNRAKSVGGRIGLTPLRDAQLLNVGVGGWWGEERGEELDGGRWVVDVDATWSPLASLVLGLEVAYGGEARVSFRERGAPFAAGAVADRDARWLGAYALGHYDLAPWLGVTVRYGVFDDGDGARTGVEQVLQSVTVAPVLHLSRLVPGAPPLGVAYPRTMHPLDWADLRLEYRLNRSGAAVFSEAAPGTPVAAAATTAHQLTLQSVVNF